MAESMVKGLLAAIGMSVGMHSFRGGFAEACEIEATVVHAMALGIDQATARDLVTGLRRETAWDWPRIRREIALRANPEPHDSGLPHESS